MTGIEPQGVPIAGERLGRLSQILQCVAQVVVSFHMIWIKAQSLPVAGKRLRELAVTRQGGAQIVMRVRFERIEPDCLRKACDGLVGPASDLEYQPQFGADLGIRGIMLQDLPIELLRLPQVAVLMMARRKVK